jgi:hypothetical protein
MRSLSWIVLIPLLLASQTARAASRESRERAARVACLSGDYAKGVAILSELFVDLKNPTYIFNQGRCLEQNMRHSDAVGRFQEYLRVGKNLSKAERADAEKHIADCKVLLASQPQPAIAEPAVVPAPAGLAPAAVPAPAVAPQPAAPTAAVEAAPPMVQQTNPQPASESGSGLRTAGIITAAVGGAVLVTGVILNLKVNSVASDMQKTNGYTDSKDSDRKTYETLGWIGYGVGAACVATGAILYYLGVRAPGTASVALVPALAPGQAGAFVKGVF